MELLNPMFDKEFNSDGKEMRKINKLPSQSSQAYRMEDGRIAIDYTHLGYVDPNGTAKQIRAERFIGVSIADAVSQIFKKYAA